MTLREKIDWFSTKRQNTILSATMVLAVTFGLSAILGFLRSRFLYTRFFSCCVLDLDVYNAAFRLPDLIFKLLVTGALSASFIPVYSSYLHRDEKEANAMASSVINLLLGLFLVISVLVFIFAYPFSKAIATGFNPQQLTLMVSLTRILLLAQIFFLLSNFITGILQVHQAFIVPSLSPIIYNLCIILSIFILTPIFGIYGAVYGAVIGAFFHLAIQVPVLKKVGFHYLLEINFHLKGVKEIIRLMIPRSLSLGIGEIEDTITLFFASTLAAGSISILSLALQLMYLPSRILGTTVGQASLPILSKSVAKNELDVFRNTVSKTLLQSLFIALPFTIIILIERVPLVRIAFGGRQFPWAATLLTAKTLAFLTPAIVCQALIEILIRAFYALHDTKTPLKISAISLISTVITSYFFVNFTSLGVIGLAISASIGGILQSVGLVIIFIQRVDGFNWTPIYKRAIKIIIASTIMGLTTWGAHRLLDTFILDTSRTIYVITLSAIASFAGIITYVLFSSLIKIEEYHDFRRHLLKLKISKFSRK